MVNQLEESSDAVVEASRASQTVGLVMGVVSLVFAGFSCLIFWTTFSGSVHSSLLQALCLFVGLTGFAAFGDLLIRWREQETALTTAFELLRSRMYRTVALSAFSVFIPVTIVPLLLGLCLNQVGDKSLIDYDLLIAAYAMFISIPLVWLCFTCASMVVKVTSMALLLVDIELVQEDPTDENVSTARRSLKIIRNVH